MSKIAAYTVDNLLTLVGLILDRIEVVSIKSHF